MGKHGVASVQLPSLGFISGTCISAPNNQAVTVPSEATIFEIGAETAVCYYAINNPICSTTSHGFVAQNTVRTVGPISGLSTLRVHAPGGVVHITFFKEA